MYHHQILLPVILTFHIFFGFSVSFPLNCRNKNIFSKKLTKLNEKTHIILRIVKITLPIQKFPEINPYDKNFFA